MPLVILLAGLSAFQPPRSGHAAPAPRKEVSVFYPAQLLETVRSGARRNPWAASIRKEIVSAAKPWLKFSDEQLFSLIFSNSIKRAWQVWSDGYCPACKGSVPMYNWQMDPFNHPWKARCPHCKELFPKNDFEKYYRTGLDERGLFDPARADRSLLYNTEHPDPKDPLHRFGVDDGEGYVADGHRWRFIGAYLIYGQWKQAILNGILRLSSAYLVTGERRYAHRAGILLDRLADVYPTFDFGKEGVMYEGPPHTGYISTWHDACEEVRQLALAYDQAFEGLKQDKSLVAFLKRKSRHLGLENPKSSFEDIQRNIEERIFQDTLTHRHKIASNYPTTEVAVAVIKTVLDWEGQRAEIEEILDAIIRQATAVDGMTGEKGLTGYTVIGPRNVAVLLGQFSRIEPDFLKKAVQRHPRLRDMFRFHIDTWCLQKYYPQSGDTGTFAGPVTQYMGVGFSKNPGLEPSMFTFLRQLYEITGDASFIQVLYHANNHTVEGLPYDLFAENPEAFRKSVQEVIDKEGADIRVGSVNKQEWHLAILRSGEGPHARALWLDYDAGGGHGHADGLN
ncbi:MAG: hypothetical protein IT210_12925, partial [Armatimonadetes bacterium]|nr:hypothetical protein [Armatimonadota bacterium]